MSETANPVRLERRDRVALTHRLTGVAFGFSLAAWSFATSSWSSGWTIAGFALVAIGGPLSYHVLTSVVTCPRCAFRVTNFRIPAVDARRKLFPCERCGAVSYLNEGFYWERDVAG